MSNLTVICGEDEFLVQERGKAIFAEWVETTGADEFSREVIDGRVGNQEELASVLQQFQASTQTLSLFGPEKVVWLRDVSFLGDNVTGRAKRTQEMLDDQLKPLLKQVEEGGVRVLFTAFPVDRRRSFFKWLQKRGAFEFIPGAGEKDPTALHGLIQKIEAGTGVEVDPDARDLLIERVSGSARMVQIETEKLANYVGPDGGTITPEVVNFLVPHYGEANFFEAVEVFYQLRLERALRALERHFFTNADARGLISSLQGRNRLLIQLRVLLDADYLGERIQKDRLSRAEANFSDLFTGVGGKSGFNVFSQNPYYLSRLSRTAGRLPLKRLIDFQEAFLDAFEQCLQRPHDQEGVMREIFVRCLS